MRQSIIAIISAALLILAACGVQDDGPTTRGATAKGDWLADAYVCGGFTDNCPEQMFCPDGQGERSCMMCPLASCAAPPPGCGYSGEDWIDDNGCAYGCGSLVCHDDDGDAVCGGFTNRCPKGSICPDGIGERKCMMCPLLSCAAPPPGCGYAAPYGVDDNGCATDCGKLVCTDTDGDSICGGFSNRCPQGMICPDGIGERKCMMCPLLSCAAPPPGCDYAAPYGVDDNGCATDCGKLLCTSTSAE